MIHTIVILSLIFYSSAILSCEPSYYQKSCELVQQQVDTHIVKRMSKKTTYTHGSLEHIADLATLVILPTPISRQVLACQRSNMKKFLKENEKAAQQGIQKYWEFDKETWQKIVEDNKKEHKLNLEDMRSSFNCSTAHHSKNLPDRMLCSFEKECKRYNFNPHNFNLRTPDDIKPSIVASASVKKRLKSGLYDPADIDFNLIYADCSQAALDHLVTHELTHIKKGHSLLAQNIKYGMLNQLKQKVAEIQAAKMPAEFVKTFAEHHEAKMDSYESSPEYKAFIAAQEKTADTYVICSDRQAAKNIPTCLHHADYPNNYNDMRVLATNWDLNDIIQEPDKFKRAGKACIKHLCTIL